MRVAKVGHLEGLAIALDDIEREFYGGSNGQHRRGGGEDQGKASDADELWGPSVSYVLQGWTSWQLTILSVNLDVWRRDVFVWSLKMKMVMMVSVGRGIGHFYSFTRAVFPGAAQNEDPTGSPMQGMKPSS